MYNTVDINTFIGKVFSDIKSSNKEIRFFTEDGEEFLMYHEQDCCEDVSIDDINGDLKDLIGNPITMAEEVTSTDNPPGIIKEDQDSFTWTFYKLATIKGYVNIRWYGESNGYYSESVYIRKIK